MKRLIPKVEIDKAKKELRDSFISRIIKDVNAKGCWHLKSIEKSKIVDFIVHFSERGTKKIFFKAKRLALKEIWQKILPYIQSVMINIALTPIIIIHLLSKTI